ncbi:hypothetical protein DEJ23_06080 [Curtobacterium sp. MCSS17_008]|uniref:hypothetical protein n=1 Tax=Curtobacterium sp. MCSS17_008 TaxID=2175647 RepID=UPI000DA869D2|nr:hypothetical protein [Curtobacterium sp. MCSS17_008]PZF57708.1 hypothetical protein DEJ23_06080 [Curtobacterium sp. MCSS17_008]
MSNTTRLGPVPLSRRATIAAAVLLLVGGGLTACSSTGGATDPTPSASGTTTSVKDRTLAINQCLRDKGYAVSDEGAGDDGHKFSVPEGADPDQYLADAAECADKVPGGGAVGVTGPAQSSGSSPEFAECLRDGGFPDFPDDPEAQTEYQPGDEQGYEQRVERCFDEHPPVSGGH